MDISNRNGIRKYMIDIKNYKVIQKINSGGFSCIYEVQKINNGKIYAAKVINTQLNKEQYIKMINREVGIMIRCQHPTIINFIGYSFTDFFDRKNVTIIMELAEQGTLADAIEKVQKGLANNNYDNTARQIILVGIARGMMYLHQHQILHRDLKPSNILLDKNLHPHITDFGLSKLTETDSSSIQYNLPCGTPIYMAPEVMEEKRYNGKADVYSFGILMFEVVTDSMAFPLFQKGKISTLQFYHKVVYDNYRPTFKEPIKKSIKKLIERCWSKDPKERPTFEELFKKLAFNVEDSIYDIFEGQENNNNNDNSDKYYLDDVDTEILFSYLDEINSSSSFSCNENSMNIEKDFQPFKCENRELKIQLFHFMNENEKMKNIINNIQKDNEYLSLKVEFVSKENEEMKNVMTSIKQENENLSNKVESISKENEEMKQKLLNLEKQFELMNSSKKIENEKKQESPIKELNNQNLNFNDEDDEEKVSIDNFNSMTLSEQHLSISKIISKSQKYPILEKINCLLQFFLRIKQAFSFTSCINIEKNNTKNEFLHQIKKENKILILHKGIEILFFNNFFNEREFIDVLKNIGDISISIKFPSNSFIEIYSNLLKIKKQSVRNIKIGVFVTGIKKITNEFKENKNINFIKIDSTVTEIKEEKLGSFRKCTSLNKIEIPSSVKRIGSRSFFNCSLLIQINIPSSVSVINYATFYGCSSLITITIPSSIKAIEAMAFYQCVSLKQIELPSSVTEIGYQAFEQCSSLTQIKIPSSITFIKDWTFRLCTSLLHVEIPSSVTGIGKEAFNECTSLLQIKIPLSLKTIGNGAFMPTTKIIKY